MVRIQLMPLGLAPYKLTKFVQNSTLFPDVSWGHFVWNQLGSLLFQGQFLVQDCEGHTV